jgi:hypothetical protein
MLAGHSNLAIIAFLRTVATTHTYAALKLQEDVTQYILPRIIGARTAMLQKHRGKPSMS